MNELERAIAQYTNKIIALETSLREMIGTK
jgi:hypothetical protein